MKLCIIKPPGGGELVLKYTEYYDEEGSRYVRLSEIVDVEFPRLSDQVTIEKQLKQIDAKEQQLRNQLQHHLDELQAERQNLLALPNHA